MKNNSVSHRCYRSFPAGAALVALLLAGSLEADTGVEFLQKIEQKSEQGASYFPLRVFTTDSYVYALEGGDGQKCIAVWTTAGLTGTLVGTFRPTGIQFQTPCGMARQPGANRFAVADAGLHVVYVFSFNESLMTPGNIASGFTHEFTIGESGKNVARGGVFTAPQGVAMPRNGRRAGKGAA